MCDSELFALIISAACCAFEFLTGSSVITGGTPASARTKLTRVVTASLKA